VKFQIQRELRSKPETRKGGKRKLLRAGANRMVVRTILLVSAEEYSDGSIHRSASGKMPYRHSVSSLSHGGEVAPRGRYLTRLHRLRQHS
jgi:hypothetical protein